MTDDDDLWEWCKPTGKGDRHIRLTMPADMDSTEVRTAYEVLEEAQRALNAILSAPTTPLKTGPDALDVPRLKTAY